MNAPAHAITCWLSGDSIVVQYPDHQQVVIPQHMVGRLIAIMRQAEPTPFVRAIRDLAREAAAHEHAEAVRADRRKAAEERDKREHKRLVRRTETKRLTDIGNLIGL